MNSNLDVYLNEESEERDRDNHNFLFDNEGKGGIEKNTLDDQQEERIECSVCNRKFYKDRIEVHENACKKSSKKRKVFDSKENRVQEKINLFYFFNFKNNLV